MNRPATTNPREASRAVYAHYAAYVALFWQLYALPPGDPGRAPLARAVEQANARWRASARQRPDPAIRPGGDVTAGTPDAAI